MTFIQTHAEKKFTLPKNAANIGKQVKQTENIAAPDNKEGKKKEKKSVDMKKGAGATKDKQEL